MPLDAINEPETDETVETTDEVETPETPSDEPLSFQQAFAKAKEEHSRPASTPKAGEASTATEPTELPLTSKGQAEPTSAKTAPTKTKVDPNNLLSDEEFSALQKKHATDPAALRKALEGAFTKKTQALAEERRAATRFEPYVDLIDAYEEDPKAVVLALAKQHGLTIANPEAPATAEGTTTAVDAVLDEFKGALGPEFEYLAEGLAPAITKLVERLTAATVEKVTEPLKAQTKGLLDKQATDTTAQVMKTFEEAHPDWQEHEEALVALSQKLSPKGMTETEYLDHLYTLVTADTSVEARDKMIEARVADQVKKAIAKMTRGAESTETRTEATPERHVRTGPPATPTFQEAYEAAKRGERWA